MAQTANTGTGCFDPCQRTIEDAVNENGTSQTGGIFNHLGQGIAPGSYIGQARTQATAWRIALPGAQIDRCEAGPDKYITMFSQTNNRARMSVGGAVGGPQSFAWGNRNGSFFWWYFENPLGLNVDWGLTFGSWNGNERITLASGADEFVRGVGSNVQTSEDVGSVTYSDGNRGNGSRAWFVNRQTQVRNLHIPQNGLSSGGGFLWRRWPQSRTQLCDPTALPEDCTGTTTPRFRLGWEQVSDPIDWFTEFEEDIGGAGWEHSDDAGVTWNAAPPSTVNAAAEANGNRRWRHDFTIPQGMGGWFRVRSMARTANGRPGLPGSAWLDGSTVGTSNIPNRNNSPSYGSNHYHTDYIEVAAGSHRFEWWENNITAGSESHPHFIADYKGVLKDRTQLQVIECLDAAGVVVNTDYYTDQNAPTTLTAGSDFTFGLIP